MTGADAEEPTQGSAPGVSRQAALPGMPTPLYPASPSRLLAWLDCPRRYRMQYLDRPRPQARPQRAHTSVGITTHNVLRDFWDLPPGRRTPDGVAELVRSSWIDVGFRDPEQSAAWRLRVRDAVVDYLRGADRERQPVGIERSVALRTESIAVTGRVDRLDDRDGELVVVDYKTGRQVPTEEDARTSLPLALYAAGAARTFRRECVRVELHHVPSGTQVAHVHTAESISSKIDEAESIATDLRRVDAEFADLGVESPSFPPRPSPLCTWCDFRAHCAEGQRMGPEKSDWAGLEDRSDVGAEPGWARGE
ncbi:PD-(D/E)XK nuclease family protein [Intrasporangium calvum]|uniref:PD-(D/E)XK nuclease family protein n=1 Tax=Intrasporangium calvum TaxID=53358 RepID=A0ABT5GK54_9MICO|nr:PD-(D/E)XK nuclease family protein [Intrasporangium calvum]MDC5698618.1 PD-(D/E)XK nuclease family protein [Intrasporangium calvum]